jgi:extracellular serine/threonine protein kinase FAM20C
LSQDLETQRGSAQWKLTIDGLCFDFSFNKASTDDPTILAPLYQCCLIRRSTLRRLLDLTRGPKSISQLLDMSLKSDLLYPVLSPPHLKAVDRRLHGILDTLEKCLEQSTNPSNVIIQEDLKAFQPV